MSLRRARRCTPRRTDKWRRWRQSYGARRVKINCNIINNRIDAGYTILGGKKTTVNYQLSDFEQKGEEDIGFFFFNYIRPFGASELRAKKKKWLSKICSNCMSSPKKFRPKPSTSN